MRSPDPPLPPLHPPLPPPNLPLLSPNLPLPLLPRPLRSPNPPLLPTHVVLGGRTNRCSRSVWASTLGFVWLQSIAP